MPAATLPHLATAGHPHVVLAPASCDATGAASTRDQLVTDHLPLVGHVVRETMSRLPQHVQRDDLTSAGMLALVQAAQAFDAERGVPFAAYAATRIRGAVLDELRRVDWASRAVRRTARDLDETRARLAPALGRVPTTAEVASALGVSVEDVVRNQDDVARASVLSIEGTEDIEGRVGPARTPNPAEVVEHAELLTYLMESVAELPERLRAVITGYFVEERPMAELAAELGVTESRISQMRAEALVLLRGVLHRELDPELEQAPARPQGCVARRRETYYAAVATRHALGVRRLAGTDLDATA